MSVVAISFSPRLVRVAADSQITSDHARPGFCKVERMDCGALVGMVGTPLWTTFVRRYEGEPVDRYSAEQMALDWVDWARSGGSAVEDNMPIGCLVVVTPSAEVYQLCPDGAAIPIDGPIAIGSGGPFALGAIHAGATAGKAVAIAIKLDPFCGGEIQTWGMPR